jgi:predicted DNA-binding transcriptional regulator AlpA
MTEQPPDRILRLNAVLDRTGLTRATLYRKIQAGVSPSRSASPRAAPAGGIHHPRMDAQSHVL